MPDEDQEEFEPKISLPEIILIGLIFLLIDLAEVVIVLVGLDDFWILDLIASAMFIYLFMKGVPPMRQLVTWILELIPWLGALPLLTVGWMATVWADRHPSGILAKAGAIAGAVKGGARAAPSAGKMGARSLQQMERAERRAGRVLRREVPPTRLEQAAVEAGGAEAAGAARKGEAAVTEKEAAGKLPGAEKEVPGEALGEAPTPFEKLQKLTKELPPEEKRERKE